MAYLDLNQAVFQRDENKKLIPQEVVLESLDDKPQMKLTPLLKGEIQRVVAAAKSSSEKEKQLDDEIISQHTIEPNIPLEKTKDLKLAYAEAIIVALMSISVGKSQVEVKKMMRDSTALKVLEEENFLSKKG